MPTPGFFASLGVLLVAVTVAPPDPGALPQAAEDRVTFDAGDYAISGPFTHENLTIYLVRGADRLKDKRYLTLQEAMEKKLVVVHETGSVNELSIENLSPDTDLYIQSGDIVKGGRQDRTIAMDFVCPPKSGQMPINAFCVEHGRWTRRGTEDSAAFGSSNNSIAGKDLKLAAKAQMSQSQVWNEVAQNQARLGNNAGGTVASINSPTSFQLSLEDKKVREMTDAYKKTLVGITDGQSDVIGYVMAINGELNSADVYASHDLFMKLWPKLLDSAAVEAFAELQKDKKFSEIKPEAIKAAIDEADHAKDSSRDVTRRVQLVTRETKKNLLFETRDRESQSPWLHRNYITQDEHPTTRPAQPVNTFEINQAPNPPAQQQSQSRRGG